MNETHIRSLTLVTLLSAACGPNQISSAGSDEGSEGGEASEGSEGDETSEGSETGEEPEPEPLTCIDEGALTRPFAAISDSARRVQLYETGSTTASLVLDELGPEQSYVNLRLGASETYVVIASQYDEHRVISLFERDSGALQWTTDMGEGWEGAGLPRVDEQGRVWMFINPDFEDWGTAFISPDDIEFVPLLSVHPRVEDGWAPASFEGGSVGYWSMDSTSFQAVTERHAVTIDGRWEYVGADGDYHLTDRFGDTAFPLPQTQWFLWNASDIVGTKRLFHPSNLGKLGGEVIVLDVETGEVDQFELELPPDLEPLECEAGYAVNLAMDENGNFYLAGKDPNDNLVYVIAWTEATGWTRVGAPLADMGELSLHAYSDTLTAIAGGGGAFSCPNMGPAQNPPPGTLFGRSIQFIQTADGVSQDVTTLGSFSADPSENCLLWHGFGPDLQVGLYDARDREVLFLDDLEATANTFRWLP